MQKLISDQDVVSNAALTIATVLLRHRLSI